ncbi:MAG: VTT domain-containing protein [Ruminococcaceae bacterium]|nr:VTT domain-containing protein [Oscillospiraceae bacterium]
MKDFFNKNKKMIVNGLLTLGIFIGVSVVCMLIFWACGIIYFQDGMQFNMDIFDSFKNSWTGYVMVVLLEVIFTTLLCFVPGASMMFIVVIQNLYSNPFIAFAVAFTGVLLSSLFMYISGRFGGYNLCVKFLGKEDCEKATKLLRNKGTAFFPLMMLFPVFPDDALVMIAGTMKMSMAWFIPSIIVGRGIGTATIVFGLSFIPFELLTTPWHWIGAIAIFAVVVVGLFFGAFKLNKYMEKRNNLK